MKTPFETLEKRVRAMASEPGSWDLNAKDVEALHAVLACVDALRAARPFFEEDFPPVANGINWSAYPVTFGYARAYRQMLEALGVDVTRKEKS